VPRVAGDFLAEPRGLVEVLALVLELDLGYHEAGVLPEELVDLDGEAAMRDPVAFLLENRTLGERVEHGIAVCDGNLVFVLRASGHHREALDRDVRFVARRRGRKHALLALAHRLLVVVYHVLNNGRTYTEFGAHYLDRRRHEAHTRYFLRRLRELGYEAT